MAVNNVVINTAQTASFLLGEPDPRYIYNFVKSFKVWFERKYCFLLNFNITFPRYILSFAAWKEKDDLGKRLGSLDNSNKHLTFNL